ncbi:MAG: DUF11 domain-containing protein, partial [Cytophagaceae bacterium]
MLLSAGVPHYSLIIPSQMNVTSTLKTGFKQPHSAPDAPQNKRTQPAFTGQLLYFFERLVLQLSCMLATWTFVSRFLQITIDHKSVWFSGQPVIGNRLERPPRWAEPPDKRSRYPLFGNLSSLQIPPLAMNDLFLQNQFLRRISSFWAYLLAFLHKRTGSASLSSTNVLRRVSVATCLLLGLAAGAFAQPSGVNLKLEKSISNASPAIGDVITYTVAVTNTGSATATSVVVSESMTAGLSTFLSSTASVGAFSFNTTSYTGSWTIGSVSPGQTVTLLISAKVDGEGVSFNSAEVASMDGTDANSTPGNGSLAEDDYDNACFSVPLTWYAGDEYTVDKPAGFSAVTWLVNGNPISGTTTEASVDAAGNLTIKAPGIFSFTGKLNGCDVSNCCNILVNPGVTASLGDFVFEDKNANGIQDTGDVPIPGVLVTLYDNGSAIATTTTDANGLYSFTGLTPGTSISYSVGFTAPAGYTTTTPLSGTDTAKDSDAGADPLTGRSYSVGFGQPSGFAATSANVGSDALDSDADPITGRTAGLTLTSGENNTSVDAGFYQPTAGLGDYVFEDKNANGVQDTGDVPIPGVLVTLYTNGSAISTTTTDANGLYSFTGLTPSTPYVVGFGQPAGFQPTAANVGTNDAIDSDAGVGGLTGTYSLTANEFNPTVDAGFYKPASLGDYVFNDKNRDGIQDAGDSPIPGVVVTLYQNGTAVQTTTTDVNGLYSFTGLTPGTSNSYVVGFTAPAGYSTTSPLSGTDATKDSNADPITGRSTSVTLASGENNPTIDAGFYQPTAGLGDYVFEDKNANGIQDTGDVPIPGVLVTLYTSGSAIATTTTDVNGLYSFTALTPGTPYVVGFGQPAGYVPTLANVGNDALDSDASVAT